jgi:hypothetical protein
VHRIPVLRPIPSGSPNPGCDHRLRFDNWLCGEWLGGGVSTRMKSAIPVYRPIAADTTRTRQSETAPAIHANGSKPNAPGRVNAPTRHGIVCETSCESSVNRDPLRLGPLIQPGSDATPDREPAEHLLFCTHGPCNGVTCYRCDILDADDSAGGSLGEHRRR